MTSLVGETHSEFLIGKNLKFSIILILREIIQMNAGEMTLYTTEDGKTSIQLSPVEGTVWMSQAEIADLFQTTPQNIFGKSGCPNNVTLKKRSQLLPYQINMLVEVLKDHGY